MLTKLLGILIIFTAVYTYVLLSTTNVVLNQATQLNKIYQYIANNADQVAAGQ